ncbi:hypothetical protein EXW96_25680 [Paenibacillus sp. JMULE4]|uniref:hypothetical protein n=1 Tax=Paenibacillus sp. JMULE4 TaxID=2518342 RepID=UPI0015771983|nr:hypothetical protein [Paenibacillus sp. JMULE4]NTZ20783.1 hypothetical protein [Paenibacillus sp. JMULE4]
MELRDIAHLTSQNAGSFEIHTGNFLDEFYRSDNEKRKQMVEQEPAFYPNLALHILPFLAGMAEKLCNDYNLECPAWVYRPQYYLKEPVFWMEAKGNLRLVLLVESPIEFRLRNIFTSANSLTRV